MGWEARTPKREAAGEVSDSPTTDVLLATVLPSAAKPRLVASAQRPAGSVRDFIATAFEVSLGSKVGMTSAYLAYVARCKERDRTAVTARHTSRALVSRAGAANW